MAKVTRDGFAFALLRFVIGLENSHYFLNQSESNWLKPITTWSLAFSRASDSFLVFNLIFHWLIVIFSFLWLAFQIALVLVLWQWMEKRSKKSRSITATPQSQCPSPTPLSQTSHSSMISQFKQRRLELDSIFWLPQPLYNGKKNVDEQEIMHYSLTKSNLSNQSEMILKVVMCANEAPIPNNTPYVTNNR